MPQHEHEYEHEHEHEHGSPYIVGSNLPFFSMRNGHNAPELDIPGRLAAWTILVFGAELRDFPRGAGAGELPPCTPPPRLSCGLPGSMC